MSMSSVPYRSVGDQVPMRIRLLKVASELFSKKGYHATSLMDIARQCGVQKSTVFHHFVSKQALALEVIQNMQTYCDEHLFKNIHAGQLISPEQQAINFMAVIQLFFLERNDAFLMSFLGMELLDEPSPFHQSIEFYFSSWLNALLKILRPLHGEDLANGLAQQSLCYLKGAQVMARVSRDPSYIRQISPYLLEVWKLK